jgi:hypothetical protein
VGEFAMLGTMKYSFSIVMAAALLVAGACDVRLARAAETVDVLIYGGTSSGIIAAVQVRRMGKSVVLIEPSNHMGGLTTGGLGATDIGNKSAIGGLARDFYHRIWLHYQNDDAWNRETRDQYYARNSRFNPKDETMWTFEPHVSSEIYREMLAEASVTPLANERIDRNRGVKKNGGRIEAIAMESGREFAAKMFIDATYEGDLMAAAGVGFHVGREANAAYSETLNGVQAKLNVKNHRFVKPVDPFVKPGDVGSGLIAGIQETKFAIGLSPITSRIRKVCFGRWRITDGCRRSCGPSSIGSVWRRMSSSTTTIGRRSFTFAKRGG